MVTPKKYRKRLRRILVKCAGYHDRRVTLRYFETYLYHAYLEGARIPRRFRSYRNSNPFMPIPPDPEDYEVRPIPRIWGRP